MTCPYCDHHDSRVIESRTTEEGKAIRRRRECLACGARFTTYERVESLLLVVVKRDGRREPFDRDKLLRGLVKACEKRPVAAAELEALVDRVETSLRNRLEPEVPSRLVGDLVLEQLKGLDEVAYIRFASVYRQFQSVREFLDELNRLES